MGTFIKTLILIIPYLVGLAISDLVLPDTANPKVKSIGTENLSKLKLEEQQPSSSPKISIFENISFAIHRNGEPAPCGHTTVTLPDALAKLNIEEGGLPDSFDKMSLHELDKLLTASIGKHALPTSACGVEKAPPEIKGKKRMTWGRGEDYRIKGIDSQLLTYCDMGEEHTPILSDHDRLKDIMTNGVSSYPCHFHTREGLRFTTYQQLVDYIQQQKLQSDQEQECSVGDDGMSVCSESHKMLDIHLYAVPAGRPFVFAPSFIGEVFEIPHVTPKSEKPISLVVMSLSPRVFDVLNFFDNEESEAIVAKALAETSETHRIKRSSTGASGYNLNSQRTSENGFDTHGKTAIVVKKRCLEVLGFEEYIESYTDGLQVLRYNKTTAYIPHMDWIDDPHKREVHNFDSAGQGTNRFATILLYMSDLGESDGGETIFKHAWPVDVAEDNRKSRNQALEEVRALGVVADLKEGSWEETMVADCRSRLAVRPQSARAVLFYSQHPNGEEDTNSLHGGCPVLHGEKWAANLWVWNGPRGGFIGAPKNKGKEDKVDDQGQIHASFINTGKDPLFKEAKLYFQDSYWGELSHGDPPLNVNTFAGHEWNIRRKSDDTFLKQIVITKEPKDQRHEV